MKQHINPLPVRTWNHAGVNWAAGEAALPVCPAGGWGRADAAYGPLPDGVHSTEVIPPACAALAGGMGEEAEQFVRRYANTVCFLRAERPAEQPFSLAYELNEAHPVTVAHQAIHAAAGSRLTVIQVCRSTPQTEGLFASFMQVCAEPGARLRLLQLQLLNDRSRYWNAVGLHIGAGAQVELIRAVLGGKTSVCSSYAHLAGRGGQYTLTAAYLGDGDRSLDFSDTAVHTGRETVSELHSAGVLCGQSRKILRGTIDFRRGAVRSVGHESEDVLLFGAQVRSRTAPLILCGEEQVEGQHAATAGRLEERLLYYLCSRGLTPAQARRMMVEARYAPVLDRLDETHRAEAMARIERGLALYA